MVTVARGIFADQGIKGFYRGIVPPVCKLISPPCVMKGVTEVQLLADLGLNPYCMAACYKS